MPGTALGLKSLVISFAVTILLNGLPLLRHHPRVATDPWSAAGVLSGLGFYFSVTYVFVLMFTRQSLFDMKHHLACDRCRRLILLDKLGDELAQVLRVPVARFSAKHLKVLARHWSGDDARLGAIRAFQAHHRHHPLVLSTADAGHGVDYRVDRPFDPDAWRREIDEGDGAARARAFAREGVFNAPGDPAVLAPQLEVVAAGLAASTPGERWAWRNLLAFCGAAGRRLLLELKQGAEGVEARLLDLLALHDELARG